MIQLYTKEILILGLTKKDLKTLTNGEALHMEIAPARGKVTFLYGPTKPAILSQLALLGFEVPEEFQRQATEDPE
jgi:hypothetical protein